MVVTQKFLSNSDGFTPICVTCVTEKRGLVTHTIRL